jgi:nucleotide-binding universal stress UspA family protein
MINVNKQTETASAPLIRILHPSDFSKASHVAFAHALKIAFLSKGELEIVHVEAHRAGHDRDIHWIEFPGVRATLARWNILPLEAAIEDALKLGLRVKKVLYRESDPLEAMVTYCEDHPPDLLVLGTHQREGFGRWLHKPVAEPLARRSHAMTLFVPTHGRGFISPVNGAVKLRRILIPVDHEPDAQAALDEVFFLATGLDCPVVEFKILHVGTERGMPTLYLLHQPNWVWQQRSVPGDAVGRILEEDATWSPDLIVMATQGHRDFLDALRGSTTERVLRGAHCPVLAVPAP